jgi:hypothetical protein
MPSPNDEATVSNAALGLRRDSSADFIVHVIYAGCSCTQRLFTHLVERGPFPGARELIVFVGEDSAKRRRAEQAGFSFRTSTQQEIVARFGLEVAPVMLAFDRAGKLRYIGGYFDRPAAISALDVRIRDRMLAGAAIDPLPVFGCAVSPRLQKSVDPLGIVYRK